MWSSMTQSMRDAAAFVDPRVTAAAQSPLQPGPVRNPVEKGQVFFEVLLEPRGDKGQDPQPVLTAACLGERPQGAVIYLGTVLGEAFEPAPPTRKPSPTLTPNRGALLRPQFDPRRYPAAQDGQIH